jgi:hypothetical protein
VTDIASMNARQAATGALLTVTLTLGGGGVAVASHSDRPVNCELVESRLNRLQAAMGQLTDVIERVQAERDEAAAAGQTRRVARLDFTLALLGYAQDALQGVIDDVDDIHRDHCDEGPPE